MVRVPVRLLLLPPVLPPAGEDGAREAEATVRFSATDPAGSGRVVRDFSGRFEPLRSTPDGERCDPAVRRTGLRAAPREGPVPEG
ncbi:hypothetical protein [Streptomyces griseus]|uniref:hypothetical protein n=1 Tax=Streptomyces griseus TaxID=1911 RepID=UPI0004C7343B|nr:hypothetical protein [Streptomyces griseus]